MATKKSRRLSGGSLSFCCADLLDAQLLQANVTHVFAFVRDNVRRIPTKDASGLVLVQNDRRAVHIDLKGVALRNVQSAAELDG